MSLLGARHSLKPFLYINSFNPHNLMSFVTIISLTLQMRKLSNLLFNIYWILISMFSFITSFQLQPPFFLCHHIVFKWMPFMKKQFYYLCVVLILNRLCFPQISQFPTCTNSHNFTHLPSTHYYGVEMNCYFLCGYLVYCF